MHKVYLDDNNQITVSCPRCNRSRNIDATPFLKARGPARLTYRFKCQHCDCGHKDCRDCTATCSNGQTNVIAIERRKFFRREVDLPGSLLGERGRQHPIRVLDLSRSGLRTRILSSHSFQIGQRVRVEFTLDDARQTHIVKEMIVRKADRKQVDGEFCTNDHDGRYDKAIGFYLMK